MAVSASFITAPSANGPDLPQLAEINTPRLVDVSMGN